MKREDHVGASVFVWRHEGARPVRRSAVTHHTAAIGFCVKGRSTFELGGTWQLEAGDVFLVPPGAPHRGVEHREQRFLGLGFCVACFSADLPEVHALFGRVRAGGSPVVRIPPPRRDFLASLFLELERALDAKLGRAVERSLLTLIVSEISRATTTAPAGSNVVADALRFIEQNCLRPLTLREVARAVGRSPAYVTSRLSELTGRSAVEWIIVNRMAEARRLLLHSDEGVDVIAERVGYADATHFIRLFRREHGVTPAVWRRKQQLSAATAPRSARG